MGILKIVDLSPVETDDFQTDAIRGLRAERKKLSPKYFYDRRGSEIFEKICDLQEYYVTRTECEILERHAHEIADEIGRDACLIEFGSGAGKKIRILLDHLRSAGAYVPVEISKDFLMESSRALLADYPELPVVAVCADFTQPFSLPPEVERFCGRKVAFFPGSTIGNFDPAEALRFMRSTARLVGTGGMFLVGVDLVKDASILEAAYDDAAGVTAEFNLNVLARMNRELGADFNLREFKHRAIFNPDQERVEMHLVSRKDQQVRVGEVPIDFRREETIHTENSYKYRPEKFEALAAEAGFSLCRRYQDPRGMFAIYLLESVLTPSAGT